MADLSPEFIASLQKIAQQDRSFNPNSFFQNINSTNSSFANLDKFKPEENEDEEKSLEEQLKEQKEDKESRQTREMTGLDWLFGKAGQIAESVMGASGMDKATARIQQEGLNPGNALELGGAFLKSIPTMAIGAPFDVAAKGYEAITGKPVSESHDDYMAEKDLNPEQRLASGGQALLFGLGMVPGWGGTGKGIAGLGKVAKAAAAGEEAGAAAFKAGQAAFEEGSKGLLGLTRDVGINVAEGAGIGALGAIRGDQDIWANGGPSTDDILSGAGTGAMQGAAMGLFGKAVEKITGAGTTPTKDRIKDKVDKDFNYDDPVVNAETMEKVGDDDYRQSTPEDERIKQFSQLNSKRDNFQAAVDKSNRDPFGHSAAITSDDIREQDINDNAQSVIAQMNHENYKTNQGGVSDRLRQRFADELNLDRNEIDKYADSNDYEGFAAYVNPALEQAYREGRAFQVTIGKQPGTNDGPLRLNLRRLTSSNDRRGTAAVHQKVLSLLNADTDGDLGGIDYNTDRIKQSKTIYDFHMLGEKSNMDWNMSSLGALVKKNPGIAKDAIKYALDRLDEESSNGLRSSFRALNPFRGDGLFAIARRKYNENKIQGYGDRENRRLSAVRENKFVDHWSDAFHAEDSDEILNKNTSNLYHDLAEWYAENDTEANYNMKKDGIKQRHYNRAAQDLSDMFGYVSDYVTHNAQSEKLNDDINWTIKAQNFDDVTDTVPAQAYEGKQPNIRSGAIYAQAAGGDATNMLPTEGNTFIRIGNLIKMAWKTTKLVDTPNMSFPDFLDKTIRYYFGLNLQGAHVSNTYETEFADAVLYRAFSRNENIALENSNGQVVIDPANNSVKDFKQSLINSYNEIREAHNKAYNSIRESGKEEVKLTDEFKLKDLATDKNFDRIMSKILTNSTDGFSLRVGDKTFTINELLQRMQDENKITSLTEIESEANGANGWGSFIKGLSDEYKSRQQNIAKNVADEVSRTTSDLVKAIHTDSWKEILSGDNIRHIDGIKSLVKWLDNIIQLVGGRSMNDYDFIQNFWDNKWFAKAKGYMLSGKVEQKEIDNALKECLLAHAVADRYGDAQNYLIKMVEAKDEGLMTEAYQWMQKAAESVTEIVQEDTYCSEKNVLNSRIEEMFYTFKKELDAGDTWVERGDFDAKFDALANTFNHWLEVSKDTSWDKKVENLLSREYGKYNENDVMLGIIRAPGEDIKDMQMTNRLLLSKYNLKDASVYEIKRHSDAVGEAKEFCKMIDTIGDNDTAVDAKMNYILATATATNDEQIIKGCGESTILPSAKIAEKAGNTVEANRYFNYTSIVKNASLKFQEFMSRYVTNIEGAITESDLMSNNRLLRQILQGVREVDVQFEDHTETINKVKFFNRYLTTKVDNVKDIGAMQWKELLTKCPKVVSLLKKDVIAVGDLSKGETVVLKQKNETLNKLYQDASKIYEEKNDKTFNDEMLDMEIRAEALNHGALFSLISSYMPYDKPVPDAKSLAKEYGNAVTKGYDAALKIMKAALVGEQQHEADGTELTDTAAIKTCIQSLQKFAYNQGDKMFEDALSGKNGPVKTETQLKDEIAIIKDNLNNEVLSESLSDFLWEKAGGSTNGSRSSKLQQAIDSTVNKISGKDTAEEVVRMMFRNRYLSEEFHRILRSKTSSTPNANDIMYTVMHQVVNDSLESITKKTDRNGKEFYVYKGRQIKSPEKIAALDNMLQSQTLIDLFTEQLNIDKPGSTFLNTTDFDNLNSYDLVSVIDAIDKRANGRFKFDVELTKDGQLIRCLNDMNEDIFTTIESAVNEYNANNGKQPFKADNIIRQVNQLMVEKEINEMRTSQNREEFKFSAYDFYFNENDGAIYDLINAASDMYRLNKNKNEYSWMGQAVQNLKEANDWEISEGFNPFSNFNAIDAMRGKEQTATSNISTMTGVNGSLPKISWVVDIFSRVKPQRSKIISKESLGGNSVDADTIYGAILDEMFVPSADRNLVEPDNGINQSTMTDSIFVSSPSLRDNIDDIMDFRYINLDKEVQVNPLIAQALNKSTKKIGNEWIQLNEYNVKRILQQIQKNPNALENPANSFVFSRGYSRTSKNFNTMTKFLMETGLLKAKKNFTSKSTAVHDRLFGNNGLSLAPDTADINPGDFASIQELATNMLERRDSWVDKFKKRVAIEVCANKLDYDSYDFVHKSNNIVSIDTEPFEIFCNRVQFQIKDPDTGQSYYIHVGQKELDALASGDLKSLVVGNEEIPVENIMNYRIEAEDPRMMFERIEKAGRRFIESKGGIDSRDCKSGEIYDAMIREWESPNKIKNLDYRSISDLIEEKDWARYGKPNVGTWFNNSLEFQSMLNGLDKDYKMQKKLDTNRKNKYSKTEWEFVGHSTSENWDKKKSDIQQFIVFDNEHKGYIPYGMIQHDTLKGEGEATKILTELNKAFESSKRNNAEDPLLKASKYKNTIILDIEENENAATDIKNRIEDYFQYMNESNNVIIMSSKMYDAFSSECERLGITPTTEVEKIGYNLIGAHNEVMSRTGYIVDARDWSIKTQDEFGVNSSSITHYRQERKPTAFVAVTNEIDRYPSAKERGTKHYVSLGGSRMGESEILAMTDRHVIRHAQTFKKDLSAFNRFQSDGAEMLEDPDDIARVWNNQDKIIWDIERPDEEIGQVSNAKPVNFTALEKYCTRDGFSNTTISKDLEGARLLVDVHDGDCIGIIRYKDKTYNDWRYIPLFYDGSDVDYLGVNYGWASNSNTEVTITQMGSHRLTKSIAPSGWVEGGVDKGFFPEFAAKGLTRAVDERIVASPYNGATGVDFDFQVEANTLSSRAKGNSPLKIVSAPIKMFYQIVAHDCKESQFSLLEKIEASKDIAINDWNKDYAKLFKLNSDTLVNRATMSTYQRAAVEKLIGIIDRLEELDGKTRIDKYTAKQLRTILSNCWAKNINPFIFLERQNWKNGNFWAPKEALMLHQVFGKDLSTVTRTFQYLCKKTKSMRDICDKDGRSIRHYDDNGKPIPPGNDKPILDPDFMWSKISGKKGEGWDWVRYEVSLDTADSHSAFHANASDELSFDIGQLYIRKLNGGGGDIKDFFRKSIVKNGDATYDELRTYYNIKPGGKNAEGRWQISNSAKSITLPQDYIEANFVKNVNQWINPTKNHIKYINMFRDYELKKNFSFYLPRKEGEYNVEGKTGTYMNAEFQKLLTETCNDLDWEPTSWNKYKAFRYILDAEGITGSTNNDAISWHILSEGATKIVNAKKNNRLIGFDETSRFSPKGSYTETRFELPITEPTFLKEIAEEQGMSYDELVKQTEDKIYKTAREIIGYADNEKQKKLLLQNCAYKLEQLGVPNELITLYDDMTFWEMEDNLNQWANRAIPGFGGMKTLLHAQAMQREQIKATQTYEKNVHNKLVESPTSKWGIRKSRRDNHDVTLAKIFRGMATLSKSLGLPRIGILEQNALDKPVNYGSARLLIDFGKKGGGPFKWGENDFRMDKQRQYDLVHSPEFSDVLTINQVARFKGEENKMIAALSSGDKSAKEYLRDLKDKMTNFEKFYDLESRVFTAADVAKGMRNNNFIDLWIRTCYDKGYTAPFEIINTIDKDGQRVNITRFEQWMEGKSDAQIAVGLLYGDQELGVPLIVGQSAWNLTLKGDLAQENVVTVFLEHAIKSSPFLDFLMTTCGNKYMRACTNTAGRSLQWVAPMSTFNYLAAKAFQSEAFMKAAQNHGWLKGFMETPEYFQMKMETAQVYNNLRQALMVDALHMTIPMLATMLAGAAFFEPPEDDKKKCNYQEWTVCGMRIGQAWWLDDILGIAAPLAAFWKSAEMGQPDFSIFLNGMKKHLSSNPFAKIGDCFTALMEPDALAEEAEELCSRYDNAPQGKPDGIEYLVASLPGMGLNWASQFITPAFVKEFWDNFHQYETSYNRVYQTSPSGKLTEAGEYGSTVKTSFSDAQIRKVTRNNVVLGTLLDLLPTGSSTSYVGDKMPRIVINDPAQITFMKKYSVMNEDGTEKSNDEKNAVAWQIITMLQNNPDTKALHDAGFYLNNETRKYVSEVLHDMYQYTKDDFNYRKEQGMLDYEVLGDGNYNLGKQRYQQFYNTYKEQLNFWNTLYKQRLWSKDLTQPMQGYNIYNTTYLQDKNGNYYATGFKEGLGGLISPITVAPEGNTAGKENDWASISAVNGQPMFDKNGNAMRGLVPVTQYSETPDIESWGTDNGYSANYGTTYSGSRSYGSRGGGGGGSIHSPSVNLNIGTPGTPRQSNLRSSQFDYLRPNYETQGSSRAYKRSSL